MNLKTNLIWLLIFFGGIVWLSSCDDIIEPSISKSQVQLEAPANQYTSINYLVSFWWDQVDHALSYHLQVVTPNFVQPGALVLDTIVAGNKFSFNLSPGNYQWRVMAENGSSQTVYATPRNFTVAASSISQQTIQLATPVNNFLTAQNDVVFEWGSLYGATKYQIEIDTNNFANESAVLVNETIPGQQLNYVFQKDDIYQWRVKALNDTAQSMWSAINIVTYDHTPPVQVTLVAPANNVTLSLPISLQWNTTATAVSYELYVLKSDSTTNYNSSFPMKLTTTDYSFDMGSSGDRVYWKVTAIDAAGNEGLPSTLRSFVLQ